MCSLLCHLERTAAYCLTGSADQLAITVSNVLADAGIRFTQKGRPILTIEIEAITAQDVPVIALKVFTIYAGPLVSAETRDIARRNAGDRAVAEPR